MKMQPLFRPKVILLLLFAAVAANALSVYFFTRVDQIVHNDLYRYGLQFSYEWAERYWTYSRLLMSFIGIAIVATNVSIVLFLVRLRSFGTGSRFASCLLLIAAIVTALFSAFFFDLIDYVVHNDLYRYGLQFNYIWAAEYWTYAKLTLGLLGLSMSVTVVSVAFLLSWPRTSEIEPFRGVRSLLKSGPAKLICPILLFSGGVALLFSIANASSVLAIIGLGLVLWGALFFYIRPEKYVKETLLAKATLPLLANLEKILKELGYKGKGIYLPPKCLKDFESSLVFVPAKTEQPLPKPEEIDEEKLYSKDSRGIFITPPGLALSKQFEETLGTFFTKTDLRYIQEKLPKLFMEDMEIAENIEIKTENKTVIVEISNHIFSEICKGARKLQKTHESIGCPLCSALACILAKATGKPIRIEREEQSQDERTTKILFTILED